MTTYTDEQHRAIAEFAGVWKPGEQCKMFFPLQSGPWCYEHRNSQAHATTPPPLDDALAIACMLNVDFNTKVRDEETGEIYDMPDNREPELWYDDLWNFRFFSWAETSRAPIFRDAIFAAVLAYLANKEPH